MLYYIINEGIISSLELRACCNSVEKTRGIKKMIPGTGELSRRRKPFLFFYSKRTIALFGISLWSRAGLNFSRSSRRSSTREVFFKQTEPRVKEKAKKTNGLKKEEKWSWRWKEREKRVRLNDKRREGETWMDSMVEQKGEGVRKAVKVGWESKGEGEEEADKANGAVKEQRRKCVKRKTKRRRRKSRRKRVEQENPGIQLRNKSETRWRRDERREFH